MAGAENVTQRRGLGDIFIRGGPPITDAATSSERNGSRFSFAELSAVPEGGTVFNTQCGHPFSGCSKHTAPLSQRFLREHSALKA